MSVNDPPCCPDPPVLGLEHGLFFAQYDHRMTSESSAPASDPASSAPVAVSVLLYSDDITTRDAVRAGVGRRPARDVEITRWHECATGPAVTEALDAGGFDIVVLDGEAAPAGGMGLCRELKNEIYQCPPIVVLTGREQDAWLAGWSLADEVVAHPIDPVALTDVIVRLARASAGAPAAS